MGVGGLELILNLERADFDGRNHKRTRRDRTTKHCVFLILVTNLPFLFCFAELSFLHKGRGDYSGYKNGFGIKIVK